MVGGAIQAAASGTAINSVSLPSTSAPPTASSIFPPLSSQGVAGWMFLNLDNRFGGGVAASGASVYSTSRPSQNWVIVHMRAEGRYGVDSDATSLANGCTQSGGTELSMMPLPQQPTKVVK